MLTMSTQWIFFMTLLKVKVHKNFILNYISHSKLIIMFFTLYISFGPVYELQYTENNHTIPGNIHCICIRLKTRYKSFTEPRLSPGSKPCTN